MVDVEVDIEVDVEVGVYQYMALSTRLLRALCGGC